MKEGGGGGGGGSGNPIFHSKFGQNPSPEWQVFVKIPVPATKIVTGVIIYIGKV